MLYRAVIKNGTNDVIAIGRDEEQGGQKYWDEGVWGDFTFENMPELPEEIKTLLDDVHGVYTLEAVNGKIVVKELSKLKAEISAYKAKQPKSKQTV